MSNHAQVRAWIEVALDAVRANFGAVRHAVGAGRAIIVMVKGDGYGLGAERIVKALDPLEPWAYGVATADEGVALRELGVQRPILVFSPLAPQAIERAAAARLTATFSDVASLTLWAEAARTHGPLDFHVEIDTGMGRAGFDWRETTQWADAVRTQESENLRWTGVFTHFHGADVADPTPTSTQWQRFQDAVGQLPVSREDLVVHAANSAAALRWPEYRGDAVRPGIFLYGGHAVADVVESVPRPRGVVAVRARIALLRDVPPGSTVGYGATYISRGWERWATVGIGYGDGLPRCLGNRGLALVRGQRVPIIGRISMDMTVVDITAVPGAEVGEPVTFMGRDGDEEITVDEVALHAGTISYEILTGFTPRLPRVEC